MNDGSAPGRGTPRRPLVLIVEDHSDTRQMYEECLSLAFEVVTAADGLKALAIVKASHPDLLITDLSLPGLDGFELVTRIRTDPEISDMRVICLSGYGGHAHEQRAREAGCDRVLQKPCMPDALLTIAEELIATRHQPSPSN